MSKFVPLPSSAISPCLSADVLGQFLADTLPQPLASAAEEHVRGCAHCRARLKEYGDDAELREWLPRARGVPSGPPHEPALQRVLEQLRVSPPQPAVKNASLAGREGPSFLAPPQQEGDLGTLGPYRIETELGRGGMGIVFRGFDTDLQRTVAVKVLRPDLADEQARARFVREAQAVARVNHDHVVRVYSVVSPPEAPPYLVMEYLGGPTLLELIRSRERLDPREAGAIIAQAAEGLAAAHAAGLIHRDIKPSNIMLDPGTGRAKITDFGLARIGEAPSTMTQEGALAGTPTYMSPEQARGLEPLDARTDVYSLGVTLYEALTGAAPFRGAPHMVLQQVVGDEPRPPRRLNDRVPRDLETICLKAMAKEPSRRYQTAREFAADLGRWQHSEPIRARPAGWGEHLWRWSRRNPGVAGLTAALVLVFVTGFIGVTWQWRRAEMNYRQSEENYREARNAAQTLINTIDGSLYTRSGSQPARQRLWRIALVHIQSLFNQRSDDPSNRHLLGMTYQCLGILTTETGKLDEAPPWYQKAEAMLAKVARDHPENPHYRNCLAANHLYVGLLQYATGQMNEALQSHEQALALQEQLLHEVPDRAWYHRNVALSYRNIGNVYVALGQPAKAREYYPQACAIQERQVKENPDDDGFLERLADIDHKMGLLYALMGQPTEALNSLKQARARWERLVQKDPGHIFWRHHLARTDLDLAILHHAQGQQNDARLCLEKARPSLEPLTRENLEVTEFQRTLAEACLLAGNLQREDRHYAEALRDLERARDLCQQLLHDNPAVTQSQVILAKSYAGIGFVQREKGLKEDALSSLEKARTVWAKLVQDHPDIPGFQNGLVQASSELEAQLRKSSRVP
jgi:serine/threonine protein kinase